MRRTLTLLVSVLTGALIAALVVVAVPAEGAPNGGGPGDPLLLSRVNQAGPMTVLKTNGGFRILAKDPKRPPLMIYSPDSMPPLDVSSTAKVENLNVDLLDGMDSTAFSPVTHSHDDRYYTETESDSRFVRNEDLVLPVAAYAGGDQFLTIPHDYIVVRSVTLTPPSGGTVIVNSVGSVSEDNAGEGVLCSITTGTTIDAAHVQLWSSGGLGGNDMSMFAGTRGFTVDGKSKFTANLVCVNGGLIEGSSTIRDSEMTAIFIPNP